MDKARGILEKSIGPRRRARLEAVALRRLGAVRVVIDHLHHPHNLSAVLRTCEALGVQHVHVVDDPQHVQTSRRITLGAQKWLSLHRHDRFEECAELLHGIGFRIYAAMLDLEALALEEIPVGDPVALVFGNEREGVGETSRRCCDGSYTIPMEGFSQSFNVSVAAAISLYSITRRVRLLRPDQGLLPEPERADLLASWLPKGLRCGRRIMEAARSE